MIVEGKQIGEILAHVVKSLHASRILVKTLVVPPDPSLLESMRSIGYTVEAAVADVIDNSVAAASRNIDILISSSGPFELSIVDDGSGMSRDEAVDAMRLAATSPTKLRRPDDLGRFGLGLKTASLSQCRVLTVVSKKDGVVTALQWSLDHVIATGDWELIELDPDDYTSSVGWSQLAECESGTWVHWGNLDQLMITEGDDQSAFDQVAVRVRDHVALVFHLFNSGDGVPKISFSMNGSPIEPIDPFMSQSRLTTHTPWESINIDGENVRLMAYTLPYLSRLSSTDRARVLRLGGLRETQGFYVYRSGRLVIWGTWFRVLLRSEMAKLTRVRVDIPNTLDHLWALDVKKSSADPPPVIRRRLSELAKTMMAPSQRVQEFRGRKVQIHSTVDYMWTPLTNGDEFHYEVNPKHPSIEAFVHVLPDDLKRQFELVLKDLQNTFPIIDAHNRLSGDSVPSTPQNDELVSRAVSAWTLAATHGVNRDVFITGLCRSDPYALEPDFEAKLRKAIHE